MVAVQPSKYCGKTIILTEVVNKCFQELIFQFLKKLFWFLHNEDLQLVSSAGQWVGRLVCKFRTQK